MSIPDDPVAWEATPDDVAALLRARTKDTNGVELGAWTNATRPTLAEVETLIALAAGQITGPDGPGDTCAPICRSAIAYQAACLIELSYFPEQIRSDRSPYSELKDLLDQAVEALHACVTSGSTDGQGGGEGFGYHSLPVVPATLATYYPDGWRYPEYPATWQQACVAPTPDTPARVLIPEPPPEPLPDVQIGYPGEGDPERGLPPIITDDT
jgi:hypothetical protein